MVMAFAGWFLFRDQPAPFRIIRDIESPPSLQQDRDVLPPADKPAHTSAPTKSKKDMSDDYAAFFAPDAYTAVMALLNRKGPGDFALARELIFACKFAMIRVEYSGPSLGDPTFSKKFAERSEASRKIQVRCGRLDSAFQEITRAWTENDEYAARALAKVSELRQWPLPKNILADAILEYSSQGRLVLLSSYLEKSGVWMGQTITDTAALNEFKAAVQLAAARVSTPSSTKISPQDDIRLLDRCFSEKDCSYAYDAAVNQLPADKRDRVMALSTQIEAALRSNDAGPFIQKE